MTITDYYANYKVNKKYPIKLNKGSDTTIDDFYNDCLGSHLLPAKNVLAWHKMLMDYANSKDPIYWIRYYEKGSKASGRWSNRRACVTRFSDGFSYVFVSNFDVHEIFNMVRLGVDPDKKEFANLMSTFKYLMHYDPGKSCEESDINAYPNIGNTRGGILTSKHWYLAHINGIKSEFIRDNGTYRAIDNHIEVPRIYPKGSMSDWKPSKVSGCMIRELSYSLTPEEKNLVKAHFLRFVDPLNYYVTPGSTSEINSVCKRIGEYEVLNNYISNKFESLYGTTAMDSFRKEALIKKPTYYSTGREVINITYEVNISSAAPLKPTTTKTISPKKATKYVMPKIGQYAKNVFESLLVSYKLNSIIIGNLMDKKYCSKELSISYPVLVVYSSGSFDPQRYYKNLVLGKFLICSQWYEKNRAKIDAWILNNGF